MMISLILAEVSLNLAEVEFRISYPLFVSNLGFEEKLCRLISQDFDVLFSSNCFLLLFWDNFLCSPH
jgi:hypothetical protein